MKWGCGEGPQIYLPCRQMLGTPLPENGPGRTEGRPLGTTRSRCRLQRAAPTPGTLCKPPRQPRACPRQGAWWEPRGHSTGPGTCFLPTLGRGSRPGGGGPGLQGQFLWALLTPE